MVHLGFRIEIIIIFFFVVGISVTADLLAHRKAKAISLTDASIWSIVWISLAIAFYGYLWSSFDKQWADLYLAGVILEKTLSVDNLMVFMVIFASFGIKSGKLQHKILYWGIIGALIFRALFVTIGTGLLNLSPWIGLGFAIVVAWSGWKMLTASGEDSVIQDYSEHWSVKLTRKFVPIFPRLYNDQFFVSDKILNSTIENDPSIKTDKQSAFFATPALLCLTAIEASDIMFAFDSVPAVIAVTEEPILIYAAMIFAILGLRSLYFILVGLTKHLLYLEKAVIVLLFFIAFKLALQSGEHLLGRNFLDINPDISLTIVLGTLMLGILASIIWPGKTGNNTAITNSKDERIKL